MHASESCLCSTFTTRLYEHYFLHVLFSVIFSHANVLCFVKRALGELIGCVLLRNTPPQSCISHFSGSSTVIYQHIYPRPHLRSALHSLESAQRLLGWDVKTHCVIVQNAGRTLVLFLVEKLFNISATTEFIHMALYPKSFIGESLKRTFFYNENKLSLCLQSCASLSSSVCVCLAQLVFTLRVVFVCLFLFCVK